MDFLLRTPFFRLFLALALGILVFQFLPLSNVMLLLLGTASIILIIIPFFIKSSGKIHKFRWIFGVAAFFFLFTTGFWLCKNNDEKNKFSSLDQNGVFKVELISAPIEKENSYQIKAQLIQKFDSVSSEKAFGNAVIYLQKNKKVESLRVGDKLLIFTEFKRPDGVQNPDGFDYSSYLKRQGILATAYISTEKWKLSDENPHLTLRRISDEVRNKLLNIYRKFDISGDEFAVLSALTLGYTDELQPVLLKSYGATGAMHILSVSGLHVGIVFAVFAFLLKFLDKKRKTKILKGIIIIVFLWIYAFITGLSPAVMRAAFMFSFVSLAECFDRKSQIFNTIFMSAFFMLLINPNSLFDIGFQLSYAAVLSIVFFQPSISKMIIVKNKLQKSLWDLIAVSIAAQLGTIPFTLYYFHQFPNYFLFTNMVAIPISTVVIYAAIVLLMVFKIPFLSVAVAFVLKWSVWLMNFLIMQIQNLPFSVSNISLNNKQLVFSFVALFFITAYFYNKKFNSLAVGLASLLIVTSMFFFQKYSILSTEKLIVFSDSKIPIVNFIHQGRNYVYTTDSVHAEKIAGNFWKCNLLDKPKYLTQSRWFNDGFVSFQGKSFFILSDNLLKNKISEKPIDIDYLVLSNKIKPKIESILSCVKPKTIIIDKSISAWYTKHVEEICQKHKINYYSIAEKGSFELNINP